MKRIIILYTLLFAHTYADYRPFLQLGTDFIIKKNLTKTIEVQNAYSSEIGIEYRDRNLSTYSTSLYLGYKRDTLVNKRKKVGDVEIKLTRPYFNILEKYHYKDFYLGLGVSYQLKPTAKYSYTYKNKFHDVVKEFDNALGFLSEVGYDVNDHVGINFKMTLIKFHIEVKRKKKIYKRTYNTSSLGLFLSYKF